MAVTDRPTLCRRLGDAAAPRPSPAGQARSFGPFTLHPVERLLLRHGRPVPLGSRALEILAALTERPGELVTREELLARAWGGALVDEANLRVQIAALRRVLGQEAGGERSVASVSGRGYCFVAPVTTAPARPGPSARQPAGRAPDAQPLIGREGTVERVLRELEEHRFVTLVGPGGVGKTALAAAVIGYLRDGGGTDVGFVDLTAVHDDDHVPEALAWALGAPPDADPVEALARRGDALIVLDNCEHVVVGAARLAEAVHGRIPGAAILATSRERLRVAGERAVQVGPLPTEPPGPDPQARDYAACPAVRLFVERARAARGAFEPSDADLIVIAGLCRRLDGLPLAIELAAARAGSGLRTLAAQIQAHLTCGAAHEPEADRDLTMTAALDWSHALLSEPERTVFRRLAVFARTFTGAAAAAVACDGRLRSEDLLDALADLTDKSLLVADTTGGATTYRFLQVTRHYAFDRLRGSGDRDETGRRHAAYLAGLFADPGTLEDPERHLSDVRAALAWAFAPAGDRAAGVRLALAAKPLWARLAFADSSAAPRARPPGSDDDAPGRLTRDRAMAIFATLAGRLGHMNGGDAELVAAWTDSFEMADRLSPDEFEAWVLWGRWLNTYLDGEQRSALRFAEAFAAHGQACGNPVEEALGLFTCGVSRFVLGDPEGSLACMRRILARGDLSASRSAVVRLQWNPLTAVRSYEAQGLWHTGRFAEGLSAAQANVALAEAEDDTASLWNALAHGACAVAVRAGDLPLAWRLVERLDSVSAGHLIRRAWALALRGMIHWRAGEFAAGARLLREGLDLQPENAFGHRFIAFVAAEADSCRALGQLDRARALIDYGLERSLRNDEVWLRPELMRVKGGILLAAGDGPGAERLLRQAVALAARHGMVGLRREAEGSLAALEDARRPGFGLPAGAARGAAIVARSRGEVGPGLLKAGRRPGPEPGRAFPEA